MNLRNFKALTTFSVDILGLGSPRAGAMAPPHPRYASATHPFPIQLDDFLEVQATNLIIMHALIHSKVSCDNFFYL